MTKLNRRNFILAAGLGTGTLSLRGTASAAPNPVLGEAKFVEELERLGMFSAGCTITASDVEGPFYKDLGLIRKDITETEPGIRLLIFLKILDVANCQPIQGAVCDLWHTNAPGRYSGFASEGTAGLTWLRGIQVTDSRGIACFETVYPGWYTGRTTHIHLKVRPTPTSELTTQLYFPDAVSDFIYMQPDYIGHGPKPVSNAADAFYEANREMTMRRDNFTALAGFKITVA